MSKEDLYTKNLITKLNKEFNARSLNYFAKNKCYLKYQNVDNNSAKINMSKKRDYYQLDILIFEKDTCCDKQCDINNKCYCNGEPLVVIEVKAESFISHDVIVYSDKAKRHKILYPFLRYGFIVINPTKQTKLAYKYFSHCENFDFAYLYNEKTDFYNFFEKIILEEIKEAKEQKNRLYGKSEIIKGYRCSINLID